MKRRGITCADQVEIHPFIQQSHIFYSPSGSFSLTGLSACLCQGTGLQSRLNCIGYLPRPVGADKKGCAVVEYFPVSSYIRNH